MAQVCSQILVSSRVLFHPPTKRSDIIILWNLCFQCLAARRSITEHPAKVLFVWSQSSTYGFAHLPALPHDKIFFSLFKVVCSQLSIGLSPFQHENGLRTFHLFILVDSEFIYLSLWTYSTMKSRHMIKVIAITTSLF
jgi:hypothetical protein